MKLLCTADWHIRSIKPECREKEEFLKTQESVLKEIAKIYHDCECNYIVHAGDIFNKAKPEKPQELEIMIYSIFNGINFLFVPGNHDLLYHSIENINKGSVGVIKNYDGFELVNDFYSGDYGFYGHAWEVDEIEVKKDKQISIGIIHKFVAKDSVPFFIKDGLTAKEVCSIYNYDIAITGDNHNGFIYKHPKTGQIVINSGCITRQKRDMKKYKPRIYILDTITKDIETVYLSDVDESVILDYTKDQKERSERIDSFIEKIQSTQDIELDFENNLNIYCKKNNVKSEVQNIIEEVSSVTGD